METHSSRPNTAIDFILSAKVDWKWLAGEAHLSLKGCLGFLCYVQSLLLRGFSSWVPIKEAGAVTFYFSCQLLPHVVSTKSYRHCASDFCPLPLKLHMQVSFPVSNLPDPQASSSSFPSEKLRSQHTWYSTPSTDGIQGLGSMDKNDKCLHTCSVAQSCPTLCKSMVCSPPGSSVHGISQARILEWVAMPSSRGSFWPRDRTHVCLHLLHCRQILYPVCHLGSP